ncbi:PaaI family thioesterase [Mycobacterium sp. ACS4331]|uniref:PaaI family thioesterase n=1 Tax=Mycobacterium sp. ACS4331 TaxID=1834121 RepID=UPI0008024F63|nr:PaaI family thioesterase [Mycobacterium sp. ACS4331]OBF12045.1 phenylacetic acid degradation protein [Mycobacterium sp. ACS4331]
MAPPIAKVHPVNTPLGRFGVETLADSPDPYIAVMPVVGLVNPLTGHPTLGPLAVLVDYVAGMVNHHRRASDEWTVSSELAMELTADAGAIIAATPDVPVLGTAHPFGAKGTSALGVCELTHGGTVIGTGSVRSVHIARPEVFQDPHTERAVDDRPRPTDLSEIMTVRGVVGEPAVLHQLPNSALNNDMGIVHGGVASAGLELVASAALNTDPRRQMTTASLRVNFVRQLTCGDDSRYMGTLVRAGRRSGVADAEAINADGSVALTARLTAYC